MEVDGDERWRCRFKPNHQLDLTLVASGIQELPVWGVCWSAPDWPIRGGRDTLLVLPVLDCMDLMDSSS